MLETPSIRRYSSVSHPLRRVATWAVKIRPVRTISRKGLVPLTGWIGSLMTWATGSLDSSMVREASTSPSVESVIVVCRGVSRCRSTCRRSDQEASRASASGLRVQERCEGVATVSSISRSPGLRTSKSGCSRSSIGFHYAVQSEKIFASFAEIAELVRSGRHRSASGIEEILLLRGPMNRGGKRRHGNDEIIAVLRDWESSETIRRAPSMKQRDEDMVHAPWRHGETREL